MVVFRVTEEKRIFQDIGFMHVYMHYPIYSSKCGKGNEGLTAQHGVAQNGTMVTGSHPVGGGEALPNSLLKVISGNSFPQEININILSCGSLTVMGVKVRRRVACARKRV